MPPLVPARVPGLRRATLGVLATTLMACSGLERLVTPGRDAATPARIAVSTSIAFTRTGADVVALDVEARYLRTDGSQPRLGQRSIPLTEAREQQVPMAFELSTCLADPARDAAQGDVNCRVVLAMALTVNGAVVDRQLVGPLVLSPGITTSVDDPVALFEISGIDLALGAGPVLSSSAVLDATVGGTMGLRATVRERSGGVVTGRPVTWTSESPAVASVDERGVVTALGPGSATIVATLEAIRRPVTVRVVRAPERLTITAAGASGRGTIRSTPAGIDCRVADGVATGACTQRFAADSVVRLRAEAEAGAAFVGWEDGCDAGAATDCAVTMGGPREVRSRFVAMRRLVVTATGDGTGRVTGPSGLDCLVQGEAVSGACEVRVAQGSRVALVASSGGEGGTGALATFAAWGGACDGATESTCPIEVGTEDVRVSAGFRDGRFLRVLLEGSGDGNVAAEPGIACARTFASTTGRCTVAVRHGTTVTLVATPGNLARFDGWSGACAGSQGTTCKVSLDASRDVSARFTALRRVVVTSAGGDGRGRVRGPAGLDCLLVGRVANGTCTVALPEGTPAVLTATPDAVPGFPQTFGGWGDDCAAATSATCTLAPTSAPRQVSVRFRDARRLDVGFVGTGTGRVTATAAGIDCAGSQAAPSGTCRGVLAHGATVTLVATPDASVTFVGWTGDCAATPGPTCTVTMDAARQAGARLARATAPVTLLATGTGGGALLVDGQVACTLLPGRSTAGCTTQLAVGSRVVITGKPSLGTDFAGLTGSCSGPSCTVEVTGPLTIGGRFDLQPIPFSLSLAGVAGSGITIDGATACAIAPGTTTATCAPTVPWGTTVTLAATVTGNVVTGSVSGACAVLPCRVTVTTPAALAARFDPAVPVTVLLSGTGGGTVTAVEGIACTRAAGTTGGQCTALAARGTIVVLTATPDGSSQLGTWGGPCTGQVGPTCRVTARETPTVTLRFDPVP